MAKMTLMDIAKANGNEAIVPLLDETVQAHPEIKLIQSRPMAGLSVKTLVRTGLGRTTGSFRNANEGLDPIKATYENRTVECYIMEARIEADKAVADADEAGWQAALAREASAVLEGEWQGLGKQFYYGARNSAKGFPGLLQAYDAANMVVDAGGTTDDVASSVWFIRDTPDHIEWRWGSNGNLGISPPRVESLTDANAKKYDGYVQVAYGRPGLQIRSQKGIGRIKKLTTDPAKGLTDELINQMLAKFSSGIRPTICLMSLRSLSQLQNSRTAISPSGAPAPWPTEINGVGGERIPIIVTDAILNTEKLAW